MKKITPYVKDTNDKWVLRKANLVTDDMKSVVKYLKNGVLALYSTTKIPDYESTSNKKVVPVSIYTDGVYAWSGITIYYVEHYGAGLPQDFLDHIRNSNFDKSKITEEQIENALDVMISNR